METFTTVSWNEMTMNLRTTIDVGVLAGLICLVAAIASLRPPGPAVNLF